MIKAEECRTMAQVRSGIDDLDDEIVRLIADRFAFIEAAARIKPRRDDIRDEERKAEVIGRVRASALKAGIPDELVGRLYEMLIEGSIAHEFAKFDARQPEGNSMRLADEQGVNSGAETTLPSAR